MIKINILTINAWLVNNIANFQRILGFLVCANLLVILFLKPVKIHSGKEMLRAISDYHFVLSVLYDCLKGRMAVLCKGAFWDRTHKRKKSSFWLKNLLDSCFN